MWPTYFFLAGKNAMSKRRRVFLTEEELDLVLATQTAEREAQTQYERLSLHPAYGRGYDSERWPFDIRRAIASQGYRRGIRKAMLNPFYNRQWRAAALWELYNIVDPAVLQRQEQAKRIVEEARAYYKV